MSNLGVKGPTGGVVHAVTLDWADWTAALPTSPTSLAAHRWASVQWADYWVKGQLSLGAVVTSVVRQRMGKAPVVQSGRALPLSLCSHPWLNRLNQSVNHWSDSQWQTTGSNQLQATTTTLIHIHSHMSCRVTKQSGEGWVCGLGTVLGWSVAGRWEGGEVCWPLTTSITWSSEIE